MDNAQILNLTVRKKRFCWSRNRYEPQEYKLKDILLGDPLPDLPVTENTEIKDFQCSSVCKISGKVGARLASIMNLEVDALKSITFHMPLGQIMKRSIKIPDIVTALQNRKVNLDHPLVAQCLENKVGLSVIVEALCLSKDVTICVDAEIKDDASASVTKVTTVDGSISYDRDRNTKLEVSSGTCLVFHCLDLIINKDDGSLQTCIDGIGRRSNAFICCRTDTLDSDKGSDIDEFLQPPELHPWFRLPSAQLAQLRSAILKFCDRPSAMHCLREEVFDSKQTLTCGGLRGDERAAWEELVRAAETHAPSLKVPLAAIFETLVSLPDDVLLQLPEMSTEEARALLALLLPQVPHKPEISAGGKLPQSAACAEIVKALHLRILPDGKLDTYKDLLTLEALARSLLALFPLHDG